jgi:putative ABC transport system permease protein
MNVLQDLRYALRLFARSPIFTVTAVLSLAAGIAGTTAIFSLADALMLRPRTGVVDPSTLVDIGRTTRGSGLDNFGYPLFEEMRAGGTLFEAMAAHQLSPQIMSLGDARSSERVFAGLVSGNYFEVIGTRPALGRFFHRDEDSTLDTHPVVVLSHEFWTRRFGANRDIVGQTIRLNNRPYSVIGVAEAGFTGTTFLGSDFWVPMAMDAHVRAADRSLRDVHNSVWMTAIGRLKPGVTTSQARDQLQAIMHNYLTARGDDRVSEWGVIVARSARVPAGMAAPVGGFLGVLGALTAIVLLIACSNVASMLLARGLDRQREFSTRLAVGASRRRILRQVLLEGLMLASIAGAVSMPLTWLLVTALSTWQPSIPVPLAIELRVDVRVIAVAFSLSAIAALTFALLPALQATRVEIAPLLAGVHATVDRRRAWFRQSLVAGQVGMALLLLVAAGLFMRSLQRAAAVDVGFNVEHVDTLQIDTRIAGYKTDADGIRVVEALRERFRLVPGVSNVAASRMVPLQGGRLGLGALRAPGSTGANGTDSVEADWDVVSPDYFETLQMPIMQGRSFTAGDRAGAPFVAIVNQTMAARVWPGQNPVGQTLVQGGDPTSAQSLQVVGIAKDGKYGYVSDTPRNFIYVPLAQQFLAEVTFYVRRAPGPSRVNELRRAVADFDPMLPVIHTEPLKDATALALLPQRLAAWITASVGSLGLFLAAIGLYGMTAFSISQRRREIAIRLAIGAPQGAVLWLVLRQAAILALTGGVVGLALAGGLALLLRSLLVGLEPIDLTAFGAAFALIVSVMFAASWTPARRASKMDPVPSLRIG